LTLQSFTGGPDGKAKKIPLEKDNYIAQLVVSRDRRVIAGNLMMLTLPLAFIFMVPDMQQTGARWFIAWMLVLIAGILANIARIVYRRKRPYLSPVCSELAGFGDPDTVAASINAEMRELQDKKGSFHITPSWLVLPSGILPNDNIMWLYPVQRRIPRTPLKESYLLVYTRDGKRWTIPAQPEYSEKLMKALKARFPWIITGYSEQMLQTWINERERKKLIETMERQKDQLSDIP
jgi:hypothetical protein